MSEYQIFVTEVNLSNNPWKFIEEPPKDGTVIWMLCLFEGQERYDKGYWDDYTRYYSYKDGDLKGEFTTEFGYCEKMIAWKPEEF